MTKVMKVLFNDGTTDDQVEKFVDGVYLYFGIEMPEVTFAVEVCEEDHEVIMVVDDEGNEILGDEEEV